MSDKEIIGIIEFTLAEKQNLNSEFIKYTFYELRVKYNLTEQDANNFIRLIKIKLENEKYKVYFIGDTYTYKNEEKIVSENELIVAIKESKEGK